MVALVASTDALAAFERVSVAALVLHMVHVGGISFLSTASLSEQCMSATQEESHKSEAIPTSLSDFPLSA